MLRLGLANLYIVPSGFGWLWLGGSALLLVVAVQTQTNGPLLLALLQLALMLLALPLTHRNLDGVELRCGQPPPGPAEGPLAYPLQLRLRHPCQGLRLRLANGAVLGPRQLAAGPHGLMVSWWPPGRGLHHPGRLRIESRAPLGLFVCWCCWCPPAPQWVWPRRRPGPVAEQRWPTAAAGAAAPVREGSADWRDLRPHRPEEGLARLAWPLLARGRGCHTKVFCDPEAQAVLLTPAPQLPLEEALEHLSHRLQLLEARGDSYGLVLGDGRSLAPGRGRQHLQEALMHLAAWT